jgi:hypothetical protein
MSLGEGLFSNRGGVEYSAGASPLAAETQEVELGVTVCAGIQRGKARRERDFHFCVFLENTNSSFSEPLAIERSSKSTLTEALSVRGIGEQELKRLHRGSGAKLCGIAPPYFAASSQPQCFNILPDHASRVRVIIDEKAIGRASRQSLKSERTCAREEIEHARAFKFEIIQAMSQDVKERLAHAV